ncbi:MAG: alpha/beta fold hydrolase [bacterium]|nr:alpha/beta fold hydrolase [bacterium]
MLKPEDYAINEQRYRLTSSAIKLMVKISPLKLNIHNLGDKGKTGSIFLFNHFTRFETFIPQYILYDKEQAFCRAVADAPLFNDRTLGDFLKSVGAIPSDLNNIMDYMVDESNQGRKLVIFPEGSMIKDRRVRDEGGRLGIYKREGAKRRKPHTGAAVIAIKSRILRDLYLMARRKGDGKMVDFYRKRFPSFKSLEDIDSFASSPVEIIPANITFYPLRRDENLLETYVKRFSGIQSKRILEELKIESNILLKKTDMDVRFGDPIKVADYLGKGYGAILKASYLVDRNSFSKKKGFFKKTFESLTFRWIKKRSEKIRDDYMNAIYDLTTINLGHLTAHAIYSLSGRDRKKAFDISYLRSLLFTGISDFRNVESLHLHGDIARRDYTDSLLTGDEAHLPKILRRFNDAGLISLNGKESFFIKDKLDQEFDFDSIRIENPALVLDNEIRSVPTAVRLLGRLFKDERVILEEKVALLLERRAEKIFERENSKFSGPQYDEVNQTDGRTKSGEPFFYRTGKKYSDRVGVLLIHGFSASPAEMKLLGENLHKSGYEIFGMRLPGHGTSPADLRERNREEWIREARIGFALVSRYCARAYVVGNSMGALVGLIALSSQIEKLSGFVAVAPAFRIKDKRLPFVSYLDGAQRLYRYFAELKTEWPYILSRPENPDINYCQVPYHGLYELYHITKEAGEYVDKLIVPTLFIQSDGEFTVDPEATYEAFKKVPAANKRLVKLDETRHVITLDEKLPVFREILGFFKEGK